MLKFLNSYRPFLGGENLYLFLNASKSPFLHSELLPETKEEPVSVILPSDSTAKLLMVIVPCWANSLQHSLHLNSPKIFLAFFNKVGAAAIDSFTVDFGSTIGSFTGDFGSTGSVGYSITAGCFVVVVVGDFGSTTTDGVEGWVTTG